MTAPKLPVSTSPAPREFTALAGAWCGNLSAIPLGLIWKGYERLRREAPSTMDREDERQVTQHLVPRIQKSMTGFEPCYLMHKPNIEESQKGASAQPPEPDFGFILNRDERVIWPIEAKILKDAADVTAYVKEVNENFLTRRYNPFSNEVALVGYLLQGKSKDAFGAISGALDCTLSRHPKFPRKPQRLSRHKCKFVENKSPFPIPVGDEVTCHHLSLMM